MILFIENDVDLPSISNNFQKRQPELKKQKTIFDTSDEEEDKEEAQLLEVDPVQDHVIRTNL